MKLVREIQMPYDLTYMWNLQKSNSQNQGVEQWLPGSGNGQNGEMLVKWYKF